MIAGGIGEQDEVDDCEDGLSGSDHEEGQLVVLEGVGCAGHAVLMYDWMWIVCRWRRWRGFDDFVVADTFRWYPAFRFEVLLTR